MKTGMFALLTVLWWGGEVEAGTICPLDFSESSQQCRGVLRYDIVVMPDACLATMEAAMPAMDEFVPKRHVISITDTTLLFISCDDACEERRIIELAEGRLAEVKREQAAISQWEQAKRKCWGNP